MALACFNLAVIAVGINHRYRAGGVHGTGLDAAADAVAILLEAGLERI